MLYEITLNMTQSNNKKIAIRYITYSSFGHQCEKLKITTLSNVEMTIDRIHACLQNRGFGSREQIIVIHYSLKNNCNAMNVP